MATLAGSAVVGVLVAMGIIYWLRPLNPGAVGLTVVLCVAASNAIALTVKKVRGK